MHGLVSEIGNANSWIKLQMVRLLMYILRLRRGIVFPAKTIDSEPIFAMDLFLNFMRNGSEVKKL